jgi:hypothetical protein
MSDGIWPHATKQEPCPVCGKPDWCRFGDRATVCMRVQSTIPAKGGGWYHFHKDVNSTGQSYSPTNRKPSPPARPIDAGRMMREWRTNTSLFQFSAYAQELGVLKESIIALGAAWAPQWNAWAWPMSDGDGYVVGIRLRSSDGLKWAVPGSRQGLFLPLPSVRLTALAYLPEGPTDSAALLSMGLYPIGRPSCNGGADHVVCALDRLGFRSAVVVRDNDKINEKTGTRPGTAGAVELKKKLRRPSVFWEPGAFKDVRAFYQAGGTADLIEQANRHKIWSRH